MRRLLGLLAAAAVGAAATGVVAGTAQDDGPGAGAGRWTAPDRTFSVTLPAGWTAKASGRAATVLQRADGTGTVVVRRRPGVEGPLPALAAPLAGALRRSLPGSRAAGTRRFTAGGREALMASVVRGSGVHAVAVVPVREDRSFSLDVVTRDGGAAAAAEAGALLQSFSAAQG